MRATNWEGDVVLFYMLTCPTMRAIDESDRQFLRSNYFSISPLVIYYLLVLNLWSALVHRKRLTA